MSSFHRPNPSFLSWSWNSGHTSQNTSTDPTPVSSMASSLYASQRSSSTSLGLLDEAWEEQFQDDNPNPFVDLGELHEAVRALYNDVQSRSSHFVVENGEFTSPEGTLRAPPVSRDETVD
ncbi:uncharacterized protein IL334_006167 [Kwoniella shivajii]|uniref:Uncharacterized protein n=1 Tax=Kwoniella shivajii TaxID=564305 RepID=A0ABZ1D5I2_9TREE|nr:hypothetical protein IL334_006167 [Kwoniella shivajii]